MGNNELDGTPITGGGDGAAVAKAEEEPSSASEPEVIAHGETSGTPITGGGDGAAIAGTGTPITGGGDEEQAGGQP